LAKHAALQVQVTNILLEYNYLENYSVRMRANSLQKHAQKLASQLHYPFLDKLIFKFSCRDEFGAEINPQEILKIDKITFTKEFSENQ